MQVPGTLPKEEECLEEEEDISGFAATVHDKSESFTMQNQNWIVEELKN